MRFEVGLILGALALILAVLSLSGFGGFPMLAVAVLLLSLAYLVPAFSGRGHLHD